MHSECNYTVLLKPNICRPVSPACFLSEQHDITVSLCVNIFAFTCHLAVASV